MDQGYDYKKISIFVGILVLVLVLITAPSYYFYNKYQQAQLLLKNPSLASQEEKQKTLDKLSKLIDLPQGEDPQLAVISDITKLQSQPFFANAKNGDVVIIYNNARKAILYDPIANKIIDVAPLSIGTGSANVAGTSTSLSPTPENANIPLKPLPNPTKVSNPPPTVLPTAPY